MGGRLVEWLLVSCIIFLVGSCTLGPEEVPGTQQTLPGSSLTSRPAPDQGGATFPRLGTITSATFGERRFSFQPIYDRIDGQSTYSLQIVGDRIIMTVGCPGSEGSYSVRGKILSVCGRLYAIDMGSSANHFIVNGVALNLPAGGMYVVAPNGTFFEHH